MSVTLTLGLLICQPRVQLLQHHVSLLQLLLELLLQRRLGRLTYLGMLGVPNWIFCLGILTPVLRQKRERNCLWLGLAFAGCSLCLSPGSGFPSFLQVFLFEDLFEDVDDGLLCSLSLRHDRSSLGDTIFKPLSDKLPVMFCHSVLLLVLCLSL